MQRSIPLIVAYFPMRSSRFTTLALLKYFLWATPSSPLYDVHVFVDNSIFLDSQAQNLLAARGASITSLAPSCFDHLLEPEDISIGFTRSAQRATFIFKELASTAISKHYKYMFYVEDDCLVRRDWSLTVIPEAMAEMNRGAIMAGTTHSWNYGSAALPPHLLAAMEGICTHYGQLHSFHNPRLNWPASVYVNGALAMYDLDVILEKYLPVMDLLLATPFDVRIGQLATTALSTAGRLSFAVTHIRNLNSVYSSGGVDTVTPYARYKLLEQKYVQAVHPMKLGSFDSNQDHLEVAGLFDKVRDLIANDHQVDKDFFSHVFKLKG